MIKKGAYLELAEALTELSKALGIERTNGLRQVPAKKHIRLIILWPTVPRSAAVKMVHVCYPTTSAIELPEAGRMS